MTTDQRTSFDYGRTMGRRDARSAPAYARRERSRYREIARTAGPDERAYALGYAFGARGIRA